MAIRHIVLFRFRHSIDDETRMVGVEALRALKDTPGILEWRIEASADERKGPVVVQNALFESREAFDAYRASPQHKEVAKMLSAWANWLVADYEE